MSASTSFGFIIGPKVLEAIDIDMFVRSAAAHLSRVPMDKRLEVQQYIERAISSLERSEMTKEEAATAIREQLRAITEKMAPEAYEIKWLEVDGASRCLVALTSMMADWARQTTPCYPGTYPSPPSEVQPVKPWPRRGEPVTDFHRRTLAQVEMCAMEAAVRLVSTSELGYSTGITDTVCWHQSDLSNHLRMRLDLPGVTGEDPESPPRE